jgi:hypothetical protein
MSKNVQSKTPEEMVEAIFALDLDPIKFKLMDRKEGEGWARERTERVELEYRRYLVLLARYPEATIVPSSEVDKFWHAHILDTMKYAEDCDAVFGCFLHHFPYFGMRDEEDAANLSRASEQTWRLYEREFGTASARAANYCMKAGSRVGAVEAAYCVRAGVPAAADAGYCVRADARAATATAAYCVRAGTPESAQAAYCVRAATAAEAACCVRTQGPDVMAKGRPTLKPAKD